LANGLRSRGHSVKACFLYARTKMDSPDYPYEIVSSAAQPSLFDYARIVTKVILYLRAVKPDAVITFMPLANTCGQLGAVLAGVSRRIVSHRSPIATYSPVMRGIDLAMAHCGAYTDLAPV